MPDNGAQKHSRSYLLAVEDQEFLLRDEMRPFRFGMEYAKAEYALRDWGVRSTVVVFGSARTPSAEQAAKSDLYAWHAGTNERGSRGQCSHNCR